MAAESDSPQAAHRSSRPADRSGNVRPATSSLRDWAMVVPLWRGAAFPPATSPRTTDTSCHRPSAHLLLPHLGFRIHYPPGPRCAVVPRDVVIGVVVAVVPVDDCAALSSSRFLTRSAGSFSPAACKRASSCSAASINIWALDGWPAGTDA